MKAKKPSVLVIGTCQAQVVGECVRALNPELDVTSRLQELNTRETGATMAESLKKYDHVFAEPVPAHHLGAIGKKAFLDAHPSVTYFPTIVFTAFHPDAVYVSTSAGFVQTPMSYHSALVLYGYMHGLSAAAILDLFDEVVFEAAGYFDLWEPSRAAIVNAPSARELGLEKAFSRWEKRGCFMHTMNHPKLHVLADIAVRLLQKVGLGARPWRIEDVMADRLIGFPVWPVYPSVAARLGLEGHYGFKMSNPTAPTAAPRIMELEEFVQADLAALAKHPRESLFCDRLKDETFTEGLAKITGVRSARASYRHRDAKPERSVLLEDFSNPYDRLPPYCFWRRAVAEVEKPDLDPLVSTPFTIAREERVATAGSCFAQHMSRALKDAGYNYFVAEDAPADMSAEQAVARGFGVFSTRTGNIYTARQLRQLIEGAYGRFVPEENAWGRGDGRFVDPFRPRIQPEGFRAPKAVEEARNVHFACVREMFEKLDVFVFTLGLTEAWTSITDGAVFPLAPGVAGGRFDPSRHRFVNFGVQDVAGDLRAFMGQLRNVNPCSKVILTVSPVPLTATFEERHALVSTTYSKAVLRVAAQQIADGYDRVAYFPTYEIVTNSYHGGTYFEDNRRSVSRAGVEHVMRVFMRHFCTAEASAAPRPNHHPTEPIRDGAARELEALAQIICDEEVLDPHSRLG